jgi:hypothetical protein
VHDAFDVRLVAEKAYAVGLLRIPGDKRKVIKKVNASDSCAQVGKRPLRRGESLVMEILHNGEV